MCWGDGALGVADFAPALPFSPCHWTCWALEVSCCGGNGGVPIPGSVLFPSRGRGGGGFQGLCPCLCVFLWARTLIVLLSWAPVGALVLSSSPCCGVCVAHISGLKALVLS